MTKIISVQDKVSSSSSSKEQTFQKDLNDLTKNLEEKLSQDVDTELSGITLMEKLLRDIKS